MFYHKPTVLATANGSTGRTGISLGGILPSKAQQSGKIRLKNFCGSQNPDSPDCVERTGFGSCGSEEPEGVETDADPPMPDRSVGLGDPTGSRGPERNDGAASRLMENLGPPQHG
jgi:hypothetical protein